MRRTLQRFTLAAVVPTALALLLLPALADAQGRRPGGGGGRTASAGAGAGAGAGQTATARGQSPGRGAGGPAARPPARVVYRGGYYNGYPYWGTYYGSPFWGFGWGWGWPYWYGPWAYPGWGGYGGYGYDAQADLRLEIKPREAQVYVDGYYAGIVDDFDGIFQRLRVRPGGHELTLYLKGYRTITQDLHLSGGQDSKIKFLMEPLRAGEDSEPAPRPKSPPPPEPGTDVQPGPPERQAPMPYPPERQAPMPYPPERQAPMPPRQMPAEQGGSQMGQGFGALVIRVQPSGADVLVDGERWQGPEGAERLVIQLSEGSHRIEVRKDGYQPFSTTVQVRRGETSPINVALPPRGE